MDEINLDFLKTPPKQSHPVERTASPFVYNGVDVRFAKKRHGSRKLEMAQSIAKVDELMQEIDKLRSQNNELQRQLKDFQITAQQVQELYSTEKREHTAAKQNLDKLQTEYDKIDVDLTNKTMVNDQMKARLAEYEGRPINFNNLVVKYVKIMTKLEGEDILRYSPDRDLVEKLKEYCAVMKLKIPPVNSPKKSKTKGAKIKTQESFVQCNILEEDTDPQKQYCPTCIHKPNMQDQSMQCSSPQKQACSTCTKKPKMLDKNTQCSTEQKLDSLLPCSNKPKMQDQKTQCSPGLTCTTKPKMQDQKTQCSPELTCTKKPKMQDQKTQCSSTTTKRDQASQYISTMITRQTNTERIIKKHVQTMFPEPQKMPAIDDILNVYSRWSNIRSVSPLLESPSRTSKIKTTKKTSSAGTCTMLCNIRRKIDYLPPNNSSNIKQEIVTPSASPTPTSNPMSTNRARVSSLSSNVSTNIINPSQYNSAILNLFNANTNSALGQLSSNAFNELWQIFGKMLLSLLQTSNAGIANTSQNTGGINQQQFLDWLLELYMSSQPQTTSSSSTSTQTQTLEQMDTNVSRSPLCFNDSSILSTNVVRPEAQKSLIDRANTGDDERGASLRAESSIDNNHTHHSHQRSTSTSPTPTVYTTNFPLEGFSQDSNSMDREVQQIQLLSNTTELQTNNFIESERNDIKEAKPTSKKSKTQTKLLDQIQELIPEVNLSKKKRKALKRLLKSNNHRKNSYGTSKSKSPYDDFNEHSSVVLLTNENVNEEPIETAVDFLKTFAATQEQNFSETEKLFIEQSSTIAGETSIGTKQVAKSNDEFTFIKPTSSLPRKKSFSVTSKEVFLKPLTKRKKIKTCKKIENRYQLLFGDSDSELEEQEAERENSKAVITNKLNLSEGIKTCKNTNESTNGFEYSQNWSNSGIVCSSNYSEDTNANSCVQTCHLTLRDPPAQQEFSLPIIPTPVFDNSCDSNCTQERFSIPDLPTPILRRLECTHLPVKAPFENTNAYNYLQLETQHAALNLDECENNIEQDLELTSDEDDIANISTISKTETEIKTTNVCHKQTEVSNSRMCYFEQTQVIETQTNTEVKLKETFIAAQPLVNKTELNVEKSIECQSYLNKDRSSNDNLESQHRELSSDPLNASNFVKDLELSSDNIGDGKYNNTHQISSPTLQATHAKQIDDEESFKSFVGNSITEAEEVCSYREIFKSFAANSITEEVSSSKQIPEKVAKVTAILTDSFNLTETQINNFENLSEELTNSSSTKNIPNNLDLTCSSRNEAASPLENKESSLCWSVITISDSTINDETSNNEELPTTSENKSIKEAAAKTNNSPKMFDSNHVLKQPKQSCNAMTNTKSDTNEEQGLKTKNKVNSIYSPLKKDIRCEKHTHHQNFPVPNHENEITTTSSPILRDLQTNDISEQICKSTLCKQYGNTQNSLKINEVQTNNEIINISEDTNEESKHYNKINPKTGIQNVSIPHGNEINSHLRSPVPKLDLYLTLESDVSILNKELICNKSIDTEEETDLNDLMIDEELNDTNAKESQIAELNSTQVSESSETSCDDTMNSSNISSLLNSSLYNEVLTESLNPIVDDLLRNDVVENSLATENKPKRGRKRKSECLTEVVPCKRSQRLKAKQIVLEESLNLSKTPIKLGKYTKASKNLNNIKLNSAPQEEQKNKNSKMKPEAIECSKSLENAALLQMGFFKERSTEETRNNTTFTISETEQPKDHFELIDNTTYTISKNNLNEGTMINDTNELGINEQTRLELRAADARNKNTNGNKYPENFVYTDSPKSPPTISNTPLENFVYTDSPQSPPAHNEHTSDNYTVIPHERLAQFVPQQNNLTLFDVLINSYRVENQKHVLESITATERQRQTEILSQYDRQLMSFCYSEMELDPNCTSIQLINKLLSISCDYSLIQKALITTAQNAAGSNVHEKELPSIIQEMPPRHLSKCLQRLFAILRNLVSRNSNFCQDLIDKIELLLFNRKQSENLSLQATLNLTQLYLMACKVQECVQMPKHPARLFIAKCLYFYLQKSSLMIHEVLMWYPTVLPHREDKTYDRSDALISVLQQILMSTKYEMDKPDLRGKTLLSKLRYEYHFEPFKPALEEVLNVLVDKLKTCKFYNISLAFGLLGKRLGVLRTQHVILMQQLLPLANEYYSLALKTDAYDKRIAVLLEIISMIVKPFPIETDIKVYFSEFARFLNGFDRQLIQEAALCSILRLQRFNIEYCFKLLRHFQPTYELNTHTQAMLKSFLYRRPLTFWNNLKSQNPTSLI